MNSANAVQNKATIVLPTQPKPLYPDVPWWSVLVASLVFAAAGAGITAMLIGGSPASAGLKLPTAAALIVDTLVFMPHILLLFGVLADMFTYDGVWSIPSLVGILSIFLNYIFKYFWFGLEDMVASLFKVVNKGPTPAQTGGAYETSYKGCSVQGFESFASEYAPQTLVITATVFSYYCFDIVQNRGWVNAIAAIVMFFIAFGGQVAVLKTTNEGAGCTIETSPQQYGAISQGLRAFFEGILFGGSAYGIVKTYYPTRLPSSTVSPFPRVNAADLKMGADGKLRDANGYPYVVLPNGQAVPDFGDKQSRNAFGAMASGALGLGTAPVPGCADSTCEAQKKAQVQIATPRG